MEISKIKQQYLEKLIKFNDEAVGGGSGSAAQIPPSTAVSQVPIEDVSPQPQRWSVVKQFVNSSNVRRYAYNSQTRLLVVQFRGGAYYTYFNVDSGSFWNFALGNAVATTEGEKDGFVWFPGKNPSVGAAVWRYLRDNFEYTKGGVI